MTKKKSKKGNSKSKKDKIETKKVTNFTDTLRKWIRRNSWDIEELKKQKRLTKDKIDSRERRTIKIAKECLDILCEIVSYSAINNPDRLRKIFDEIPEQCKNSYDMPEKLTGEWALKIIVAMTSTHLDDNHREHLRYALQIGYNCKDMDKYPRKGYVVQAIDMPYIGELDSDSQSWLSNLSWFYEHRVMGNM